MNKKWNQKRKWDASTTEQKFENKLSKNGYTIIGFREYQTFTEYLIKKEGIEIEYRIYHQHDSKADEHFKTFEMFYNTKKQLEEIKAKLGIQ